MPYKDKEKEKQNYLAYRERTKKIVDEKTKLKRKLALEQMSEEEKVIYLEKRRNIALKSYYKNRDSILLKRKETSYISNLKYNYGISIEEYNILLEKQEHKCAICECNSFEKRWTNKNNNLPFVVDHCHTTNKVRGLLCDNCNLMIGHAKDNINSLKKAIKYLE